MNCIFRNHKIFILFKDFLNIGQLDNKNVFKTEIIFKIYEEKNLNLILNKIKELDFNRFKSKEILYFEEKDISDFNNSNSIKFNLIERENYNNNQKNNEYIDYSQNLLFASEKKFINKESKASNQEIDKNVSHQNEKNCNNKINYITVSKINIINEELKKLILLYIDYDKIKNKMKNALIQNYNNNNIYFYYNSYYLININWLYKFLEINKLENIYDFLIQNDIINKIDNYEKLSNEEKISKITSKIKEDSLKLIKNNQKDFSSLQNYNLFNIKSNDINVNSKKMKYFYDFILLKENTYKQFIKDLKINNINNIKNKFVCMLGEGKLFLIINENNQYSIEICNINDKKAFNIEFIFNFNSDNLFQNNIFLLIDKGYELYCNCSLISQGNNDYASPIFDENFEIIGYAYKCDNSLVEYRDYIINKYLHILIKFYLHNEYLKNLSFSKEFQFRKYYLVNGDYLNKFKKYFNYADLKNKFKQSQLLGQIINNIKLNELDDKNLYNEKKIALYFKNLSIDMNKKLNEKENSFGSEYIKNIQIEPNINIYQYENEKFLTFYKDFEILTEKMYNIIFKEVQSNLHRNNYAQCFFCDNIIMINLSIDLTGINKYILEVGKFNSENLFNPNYFLMFNEENNFHWYMQYINNELNINISSFLENLIFNNCNSLPLYDKNNNEIGKIYNLSIMYSNQTNQINIISNNNNDIQQLNNPINYLNNFTENMLKNKDNNNIKKITEIKIIQQIKPILIKQDFPFAPKIGLQNVGATCYMNSILQCLC